MGPVYPDGSTDDAPSIQHVVSLANDRWKNRQFHCDSRDELRKPLAGVKDFAGW